MYSLGADIAVSVTDVLSPTILDVDVFKMINLMELLGLISRAGGERMITPGGGGRDDRHIATLDERGARIKLQDVAALTYR